MPRQEIHKRAYRIAFTATKNAFYHSSINVQVSDLDSAIREAVNALRERQLTDAAGFLWDRWQVLYKDDRTGLWVALARGDNTGARWHHTRGGSDTER